MSAILILTPAVIAAWPAIAAACAGAAAALGMSVAQEAAESFRETKTDHSVQVEVENSEVLAQGIATGQRMVMTRGDMTVRVERDARGQVRVCVDGKAHSREELEAFGRQVAQKITQMFVYNRVMTEIKNKGFAVVQEEMDANEAVRIHVRRHVG
jgi:hypothetical protein